LQSAQKGYHAAKEGFLYKQGKIVKNWKNRWFVLKNRQLLYYKSKEVRFFFFLPFLNLLFFV